MALALLRARRLEAASWLSSAVILVNMAWVAFLVPIKGQGDIFRVGLTYLGASVAHALFSLGMAQIALMAGVSTLGFVAYALLIFQRYPAGGATLASDFATILLLVLCGNAVHLLSRRHSDTLEGIAMEEARVNREKLGELRGLLESARGGFELGGRLKAKTAESAGRSAQVDANLDSLAGASRSLADSAAAATSASAALVSLAEGMSRDASDQNAAIDETSSAVQEITATLQSIASVAKERQALLEELAADMERKKDDIAKARQSVEALSSSSRKVASSARGIVDIAEKTGLLAMNASIEAAHSGAAGKGFAVIAQEMRKLADETKASSEEISSVIGRNAEEVGLSVSTIGDFTADIESVMDSSRTAVEGMREILDGISEIMVGTKEISEALIQLVELSRRNADSIEGVKGAIGERAAAMETVSSFAAGLADRVGKLEEDFGGIRSVVESIASDGEDNERQLSALREHLERAGGRG